MKHNVDEYTKLYIVIIVVTIIFYFVDANLQVFNWKVIKTFFIWS